MVECLIQDRGVAGLSLIGGIALQVRIQRGGGGTGGPDPPGKSQVIWVSIGNKQLDPPPPLKKLDPPPPGNVGPLWNLEK